MHRYYQQHSKTPEVVDIIKISLAFQFFRNNLGLSEYILLANEP
jgi:hypothetical protein